MKKLKLFLGALLALASLAVVWAASPSAIVSWTTPTVYTDGSAMPASDIDHYTVSWTSAASNGVAIGSQQVKDLTANIPIACGTVEITVTATTTSTAIYPNTTSTPAGPVSFVSGVNCAPNPPGALAVH